MSSKHFRHQLRWFDLLITNPDVNIPAEAAPVRRRATTNSEKEGMKAAALPLTIIRMSDRNHANFRPELNKTQINLNKTNKNQGI